MIRCKPYFIGLLLGVSAIFQSCEPEIHQKGSGNPFSSGSIETERFVAIGGGFAAGVNDNEQYLSSQKASISAILAGQLAKVGSRSFKQALMYDERGLGNRLKLTLYTDCKSQQFLKQVPYGGTPDPRNTTAIGNQGPFNDLGVPNARIIDLSNTNYASSNPYSTPVCKSSAGSSILNDSKLINPDFFFFWAGEADVYPYAKNGASPSLTVNAISSTASFQTALQNSLAQLTANNARGVIANIPSISSLPFFTTVPYDALELTQAQADQLNIAYAVYPNKLHFQAGKNPFVIQDGLFARFMTPAEYVFITLNMDSVKCSGYGSFNPLPDSEVLTEQEISQVNSAVDSYNSLIESAAMNFGLAFFDANKYYKSVNAGRISFDGIQYTAKYIDGGFISLDGIYPTERGNAMMANEMIKLINTVYGARIPICDINKYPTVAIP